jgi:hypothetical protein
MEVNQRSLQWGRRPCPWIGFGQASLVYTEGVLIFQFFNAFLPLLIF